MREVLGPLDEVSRLMALLLYGAGLRRLECCRVRIKDVDVGASQLLIRDGKGHKDRVRAAGLAKHATCHTFRDSFAPICWKMARTSGPCRSCSATGTSRPR